MNGTTGRRKTNGRKKPYETPSLRCVQLATQEVLGQGCKMSDAGHNINNPVGCSAPSPCAQNGS